MVSNGAVKTSNGYVKLGEKRSIDSVEKETSTAPKRPKLTQKSNHSKWRMLDEAGRQTWHYLEDDEEEKDWPQSTADKYFLGLPLVRISLSDSIPANCPGPPNPPSCRNAPQFGQERS